MKISKEMTKQISAVQHQILIIGEATKRLSLEFRNKHTHIPWKVMAGMRDILIHSYGSPSRIFTINDWLNKNDNSSAVEVQP